MAVIVRRVLLELAGCVGDLQAEAAACELVVQGHTGETPFARMLRLKCAASGRNKFAKGLLHPTWHAPLVY